MWQARWQRQGILYEGGMFSTSDEAVAKRTTMEAALEEIQVEGPHVTEYQLAQLWEFNPVRCAACAAECATA
jgi:hypothetical protein